MLHKTWVDNFRSLEDFHLTIKPGLNVLVGPNGAGKTSIMKWFEFLSLLSSYSLRESIGKIGGANHVFRRKNEKYNDVLKFSISGSTEVNDEFMYQGNENKRIFINYEYYGEISVIKNQIFFSKQNTKIWINYNSIKDNNDEIINTEPNIHLDWSYDLLTDNVNCKIHYKT
jgi:predicted ATPase